MEKCAENLKGQVEMVVHWFQIRDCDGYHQIKRKIVHPHGGNRSQRTDFCFHHVGVFVSEAMSWQKSVSVENDSQEFPAGTFLLGFGDNTCHYSHQ